MVDISASMVKELRERTGLGMMECKKALTEAAGDLLKAEEILRIRSGAKASKASGRIAAEGVIGAFVSLDARLAALVEVNCETDFVAKNEDFVSFANQVARAVATGNPADADSLSRLPLDGGSVESARQALVQKIGENLVIRRFSRIASSAKIACYLHGTRIGVMVEFEGDDQVGKDVAMHVAFARPQFLSRTDVSEDLIAKERAILAARARESGKPAEIAARMVEGGLNKFLSEITLLGQPFVKDDKVTVEKMLATRKASVRQSRFLVVGDGLERKSTDFAAEVMAQAGLAART